MEVMDFAGPYEVYTAASRMHKRCFPEQAEALEFAQGLSCWQKPGCWMGYLQPPIGRMRLT
jgi:hypothetical protein